MVSVCVLERQGEGILENLEQCAGLYGACARALDKTGGTCDILVVSPEAGKSEKCCHDNVRCRILLAPENARVPFIDARCIVTYGMSSKSTLTISSVGSSEGLIAIQREVPTISGRIIERQEFSVREAGEPEHLLAVAGTKLLLGAYENLYLQSVTAD